MSTQKIIIFKKLALNAVKPTKAHESDAGFDLVATSVNETETYVEYGTGIAIELPEDHVGLLFPRSSVSKYTLSLANSVGVIDSGYRGEIKLRFRKSGDKIYEVGDKIGQLIIFPYPKVYFVESSDLSDSDRGEGGFGSSGTKYH